ncbi:hypothetical protein ACLX1H_008134 [Fusarium chlamydosporum]
MPDFRRLFTLLKVLTCSCFGRRKTSETRPDQVNDARVDPRGATLRDEEEWSADDHPNSESSIPLDMLPHPDVFEAVFEQDEPTAAGTADNEGEKKSPA